MYGSKGFIDQYKQSSKAAATDDPHRTIALLLAGAIERVTVASAAIERGDVPAKIRALQSAVGIVDGLRMSLDMEAGGDIAAGLEALYDYISMRLVEANSGNDREALAEVARLLGEIETAWAAIPGRLGTAIPSERAGA